MMSDRNQNTGFNWGKGLFVVIVLFIGATLGIVGFLVSLDYEMVTDNHYEKAVTYQDHIEQVEHASALSDPVDIQLDNELIQIRFPSALIGKNPTGTIRLYRPSNSDLDRQWELALDGQGIQKIPAKELARGKWLVKVRWKADSTSYYKEKGIFL